MQFYGKIYKRVLGETRLISYGAKHEQKKGVFVIDFFSIYDEFIC